jgi:hypothetical protein
MYTDDVNVFSSTSDISVMGTGINLTTRAQNVKLLWSPGIDFKESIPPAYVAWRAGLITLFLLGF